MSNRKRITEPCRRLMKVAALSRQCVSLIQLQRKSFELRMTSPLPPVPACKKSGTAEQSLPSSLLAQSDEPVVSLYLSASHGTESSPTVVRLDICATCSSSLIMCGIILL